MSQVVMDLMAILGASILSVGFLFAVAMGVFALLERYFPKAFPSPKACKYCKNGEEHPYLGW